MATSSNKVYSRIIERILESLERGEEPVWRKPFNPLQYGDLFNNPLSENRYSGQNIWLLGWTMLIEKWDSPYFATYKQIKDAGGNVKKGETGIRLVKYFEVRESKKETSERMGVAVGQVENEDRRVKFMRPAYFTVFNLKAQTEGLEDQIPESIFEIDEFEPDQKCEDVWNNYETKPEVRWIDQKAAYYPGLDFIGMPPRESFVSVEATYSTLFHEGVHSTGHKSRLNRDMSTDKKTKKYAIEELVAEIGAAFLCGHCGIDNTVLENQTAYIVGWHTRLKDNPDIIFKAIKYAERAIEYMGVPIVIEQDEIKAVA